MADAKQRGQRDTDELNALQARFDYAKSLVDWVNQTPQPPQSQTAAKTFNEVFGEVFGELQRIYACYNLKEVQDWLDKHTDMKTDDRAEFWEKTQADVDRFNKELKCPGAS
jgi:hypothetical protein